MTGTLLNNRYRVLQTIGRGGFGETFLAEDTQMPSGRRCVIKQLKPLSPDPQTFQLAQQRFQREAAILEDLGEGSSQIPKLFAYFSEGGQFYLAQEWIEGQTLTNKLKQQGVLSENSVKDIVVSLLPVLDYVHSKRIIHRDIKPDNIILRQRDGKPVLIDFGAVKEAVNAGVNYAVNTPPSIMVGTPGFMPSEQAVGQPVYASDLYSLGLTAIYALTGKLPQEMETDPQNREFLWRQYAPNVSPNLAAVLDKAIRSHWRDRYSSATEMLNALQSANIPQAASSPVPPAYQPSAVATVAVSPPAHHAGGVSAPQTPNIAPSPPVAAADERKPWLIAGLVALGVVAFALVANALVKRFSNPSVPVASPSPSVSETPIAKDPTSPPPEISASPTVTETPITKQSPSPSPSVSPTPTSQPTSKAPVIIPPITAPTRSPSPSVSPSASTPVVTPPVIFQSPSPTSSPTRSTPSPLPTESNDNQTSSDRVPIFPVGTSQSTVKSALGKSFKTVRGLWDTRAVTYPLVPNEIEFGYLFDRKTGVLRETEVAFAQSVDRQLMLNTIDGLLEGQASNDIKQGLSDVYQRRRSSYTFTSGSLRGMIVRQNCDLIYISIWEANLHEFDVAGSRRC